MKHSLIAVCLVLLMASSLSAAVTVVTQAVTTGDICERLAFSGEVKPFQEAIVSPDVSGMVEKVLVENGQPVKARQPLILLDRSRAVIALHQAEIQVKKAEQQVKESRSDFERNRILREKQVLNERAFEISESQFVNANNSLREASAGVELARLNLDRAAITAPFAGFFVNRQVFPGQWLTTGQPLGRVIDLTQAYIEARIPETHINRLRVGQECQIAGNTPGKVSFIDLYADSSRGFLIKILTGNPELRFKANM
ncbi:MAG TPA: efflux RND transporter periplasmic adaptor subunit, partial [Candidatus Ozemobacteraceae bacterium]|nr:efflux RND transporter periplasmic adaptor subunit [Candidatus Ozemobacteraceae bacterium]